MTNVDNNSNLIRQRAKHDSNFTILHNEILFLKDKDNKPIPEEILGTFWRLMSLSPNWELTIAGYSAISGTSIKRVIKHFKILEELGYLEKRMARTSSNDKITKHLYFLKETLNSDLWDTDNSDNYTTIKDKNQDKIVTNCKENENNEKIAKTQYTQLDCGKRTMYKINNVQDKQCTFCHPIKDISNKVKNTYKKLNFNKELKYIFDNFFPKGILFSNNLNNNLNKLTKLNNFSSLTKLSNAVTFLNNYLEKNPDKIDKIDVTKLNKFLENKFENLIKNENDEIINSENIQVENENIESEDEEMNIPRNIKKPKPLKGIKKEIPQESLDTLLENNPNVDKLGNMTDEQKENANLKKQLNEVKEQNSELKTKIAKASVKKKKALQYIDKMYAKDPVMSNLLVSFVEMFVQSRGSITEQALKLHLENLNSLSTDRNEQIEIIKNSIMKNYLGFYPVPNSNSKVSTIENNWGKISNVYKNTSLDKNAIQNELDGGNEETDELLMDLDAYFSNLQE